MHGNVWELCQDLYEKYPAVPVTDPKGSSGRSRLKTWDTKEVVMRGGAYFDNPSKLRSACRDWTISDLKSDHIGFRLAMDV